MLKHVSAIVLILLIVCTLSGCLSKDPEGPWTYIDETGETVKLEGIPERIMTLTPALTEIVFLLGCGDRLVGVDSDSNYPAEAKDIEKVSDWQDIYKEKVVSLDPDLVLLDQTLDGSMKRYDQLKDMGIPAYRIYPKDMSSLLKDIEEIARVLGVEEKGKDVASGLRARMDNVSSRSADDNGTRPTVLHMVYFDGTSDPWVMTSSTFSGDMVKMAGGENAIEDDTGISVQVSLERIISEDPDIIICSQSELWPSPTREKLLAEPALKDVSAVRSGFVRDLNGDIIDRTGPRLVDGLEAIRALVEEYDAGG